MIDVMTRSFSLSEHHVHLCLLRNPASLDVPLTFGMSELEIKVPANLQHKFVYFKERNVFPNAGPRARTKLQ